MSDLDRTVEALRELKELLSGAWTSKSYVQVRHIKALERALDELRTVDEPAFDGS